MRPSASYFAALVLSLGVSSACVRGGPPGAASQSPMGEWEPWQELDPLFELARSHVHPETRDRFDEAGKLLAEGKAKSADRILAGGSDSADRHWIAVARADLAALHFSRCIRGVAWRLEDNPSGPKRQIDYDPETRLGASDLSVEALLTNLDAALSAAANQPALGVQANIARARVSAYTVQCAPNDTVSQRAAAVLRADLATLAAHGHLTPDLAYVWAGVQMNEYSAAAARPFLLQAEESGYDDPSLPYLLALIAMELGDTESAAARAEAAAEAYAASQDVDREADAVLILAEIARKNSFELAGDDEKGSQAARAKAEALFLRALELNPAHPAASLGLATLATETSAHEAALTLHARLPALLGPHEGPQSFPEAAARLEAMAALAEESLETLQLIREALLWSIEEEPTAAWRGLRYYVVATLDLRLGDANAARGHAALAKAEFSELDYQPELDPQALLDHIAGAIG